MRNQDCPDCGVDLSKADSLKVVTDSDSKWYQLTKEQIEYYYKCSSCGAKLNRKGFYIVQLPMYIGFVIIMACNAIQSTKGNYVLTIGILLISLLLTYLLRNRNYIYYEKRN